MKRIFLTVLGLLLLQTAIAQEWHSLNSKSDESYSTTLLKSTDNSVVVDLVLNGFYTNEVTTSRGAAIVLSNDDMASIVEAGQPNLLSLSVPVVINDYSKMDVRVLDVSYVDYPNVELAPSRGDFPRSINPADVPYTYGDIYQEDAFFPALQVRLDSPYIIRDFRGQNIIVTPFAYNPVSKVLRVYNKMRIEMFSTKGEGENVFERRSNNINLDSDFDKIYSSRFINYKEAGAKYNVVEEQGDLLVICYDDFMVAMQPFVDWKKAIGRETTMVSTTEAGGSTNSIKTFITTQYSNNPNLTHVLLVGDYPNLVGKFIQAQTYYDDYSGYSDWWFGQIEGDDSYNELIVGRFSVESVADVTTHVDRVIHYERDINASDTWLTIGQGVSHKEGTAGHNGEDDYQHIDKIREDLLLYNYTSVHRDYSNVSGVTSSAATISEHINAGVSLINYCNHGLPTGWAVYNYNNSYVNALTNDNKLPFIISVACNNGEYTYYQPCFAEAWMRATNNSTGNPTGAIGGMFSSISQPWTPPMYGQDEMNDIIVETYSNNIKRTMGGVSLNGNLKVLDINPNSDAYKATYNTWHLYGDPTLTLRNAVPTDMGITHHPEMSKNSTMFRVNATNAGEATATLTRNGEIMGTAKFDNGVAKIQYEAPVQLGEATLTVLGFNRITYQTTIDIVETTNEPLGLDVSSSSNVIVKGESVTLNADAYGGSYNYTYSWSPSSSLNNANVINPVATPQQTTTYTCTVNDGNNTATASVTVTVVTPPTNLNATVDGNDVTLTWTPSISNATYNVYRGNTKIASDLNASTFTDNDLSQNLYTYSVTSVYQGLESPKSETASINVLELKVSTYANPSFIVEEETSTLYATATDAYGEVEYRWEPAELVDNPNSGTTIVKLTETTTFTVTATCGSQKATADVTVKVLRHPENLTATVDGNDVTLTWEGVEEADYYKVYRGETVVAAYNTTTSFVDENVPDGNHCYVVKSIHDAYNSNPSNEVCVEISECVPPTNITAEYYWYDGEFGALIEWDKMETSLTLTEYRVYKSKDNVDYSLVGTLVDVPSMTHFQYSDMSNKVGTTYYKVTAYYADEDCESEYGMAANSTDDFVAVDVTSINENMSDGVVIYPNPSKDKVNIKAEQMKSLTVVNMTGQVVMRQDVDDDQLILDISSLNSGLYILNIETDFGVMTRQINIIK